MNKKKTVIGKNKHTSFGVMALTLVVLVPVVLAGCSTGGSSAGTVVFSVTSDMQGQSGFQGVAEVLGGYVADFMVSPGDVMGSSDNRDSVLDDLHTYVGQGHPWYPAVGNHDAEDEADMAWLRAYNAGGTALPGAVNAGPPGCEETTYSFDYGNVHFAVINVYFDGISDTGTDGDVNGSLYDWLADDLAANTRPVIFVIGHEPAFPQPDADTGLLRHEYDSLNKYRANRDRFWNLLRTHGVTAYVCGHTHCFSTVNIIDSGNQSSEDIGGVWQVDAGHARGIEYEGVPSTAVVFTVHADGGVDLQVLRMDQGGNYVVMHTPSLR